MYITSIISEYDIRKCNISILYDTSHINKKEYDRISKMEKLERNVLIGNMMKEDKKIYDIIKDGQKKYTELLIKENNLSESNVYEINHDAVWVIGRICKKLKFGNNITFVRKQTYTSLYDFKIKNSHYKVYYNSGTGEFAARNFTPNNEELMDILKKIMIDMEYNDTNAVYHRLHKTLAKIDTYKDELIKGISNKIVFQRFVKDLI